jgi:transposase
MRRVTDARLSWNRELPGRHRITVRADRAYDTADFLAALRHDGLSAPCVFDGATHGARFRADVEQALAATLRAGDLVVMDNLAAHKVAGVREAIAAAGARVPICRPTAPT